jgi:hypothetical protein
MASPGFPLGPISNGASFLLVGIAGTGPSASIGVLTYQPNTPAPNQYYFGNAQTTVGNQNLAVLTASGTPDALIVADSTNGGYLGYASNGGTLYVDNSTEPVILTFSQPFFAQWWPPDSLLSGVPYVLGTTGVTGTDPYTYFALPVVSYYLCGGTNNPGQQINDPIDAALNFLCLVQPAQATCSRFTTIDGGWSLQSDCTAGAQYEYCTVGSLCGASTCNGPCSEPYYDCTYDTGANGPEFTCVFNPSKYVKDTKWWESPYFIGFMIGIVILIVLFILLAVFVFKKAQSAGQEAQQP